MRGSPWLWPGETCRGGEAAEVAGSWLDHVTRASGPLAHTTEEKEGRERGGEGRGGEGRRGE